MEYVGIHKVGSGGLCALIGGVVGAGLGWMIGYNSYPSESSANSYPGNSNGGWHINIGSADMSGSGGAVIGFLLGAPIGAAIGSTNKKHRIRGERGEFHKLVKKVRISR